MEHPNTTLLKHFYAAFAERDADTMAACYHPEVHFQDPVFDLRGARAGAMWKMLCARGTGLKVVSSGIRAYDESGVAHWKADYLFSQTGRQVHNVVDASFTFKDGLIRTHRDRFDFWLWSRQALGPLGYLLGWTPRLRTKVSTEATKALDAYIEKHPEALT